MSLSGLFLPLVLFGSYNLLSLSIDFTDVAGKAQLHGSWLSYACEGWTGLHLIVKPGLQLCNFFLMCFGDGLILVHPSCS
jgi:hypothetical protein